MIKYITTFVSALLISVTVNATEYTCDNFTLEQQQILKMAYVIGAPYDRGFTLAGIVWRESFVGQYVVRVNSKDGDHGSYGIGQMMLTTAMELTDVDSTWQARAHLAPLLMSDDIFALHLSMRLLVKNGTETNWRRSIRKYNGAGEAAEKYADDVITRIRVLEDCTFLIPAAQKAALINQMAGDA